MSKDTTRPSDRTAVAPANDQIDVLVGLLLEQARLMHGLMGGESTAFDYDVSRDRFYRLAAAPVGTNSTADRYRLLARRGVHTSGAQMWTGLPACEREG
jgi:hypothetical protein